MRKVVIALEPRDVALIAVALRETAPRLPADIAERCVKLSDFVESSENWLDVVDV